MIRLKSRTVSVLVVLLLVAGCATTANVKQIDRLESVGENPRILVMTPDVKYFLLTAGGVMQPHAVWTDAARRNFSDSLQAYADQRGIEIIRLGEDHELGDAEVAYQKLYSAVGNTILIHHFGTWKLPTKQGVFDWSVGPGVRKIAEKYDADYALFSYYRDVQASAGRTVFAGFAAVFGAYMSTGAEGGFASLVDLKTGNIVWFNQVSSGAGEMRDRDGAKVAVDLLLKDLPAGTAATTSDAG